MKQYKHVIAVVVEGYTDEDALGTILSQFFESDEVRFVICHGDITTDKTVDSKNVVRRVNNLIARVMDQYSYKKSDMEMIVHITDTDGAFIPDSKVVESDDPLTYTLDDIRTDHVALIRQRNKQKAELLFHLYKTSTINGIPYHIYFNSRNLEHVLYNIAEDISDDEKQERADDFAEQYEDKLDDFIQMISDDNLATPGTYQDTWKYISQSTHSLERHTNMHLIFKR